MSVLAREAALFFVLWLLVGAIDTRVRLQLGDSTELVAELTEADRRERLDAEVEQAGGSHGVSGNDSLELSSWLGQRGHLLSSGAARQDVLDGERELKAAGAVSVHVAQLDGGEGFNTTAGIVVVEFPSVDDPMNDAIVTAALRRCHLDYPTFARGHAAVRRGNAYLAIAWPCDWTGR